MHPLPQHPLPQNLPFSLLALEVLATVVVLARCLEMCLMRNCFVS
jgi:hypothetical protein